MGVYQNKKIKKKLFLLLFLGLILSKNLEYKEIHNFLCIYIIENPIKTVIFASFYRFYKKSNVRSINIFKFVFFFSILSFLQIYPTKQFFFNKFKNFNEPETKLKGCYELDKMV